VNEDILDALDIAVTKFFRLRDGALAAGEIDHLRNGKDAESDQN
jgi:hypothetical protein